MAALPLSFLHQAWRHNQKTAVKRVSSEIWGLCLGLGRLVRPASSFPTS